MSSKSSSIAGSRAKEAARVSEVERQPPKANAEALAFLASIQPEELKLLCFSETLAMVSEGGGQLSLQAQPGIYQDGRGAAQSCILVQATCRSHVDDTPCETSLLGYISWNLEILEQRYHEFIKLQDHPLDRQVISKRQEEQLAVNWTLKEGEELQTKSSWHPWASVSGLVSEAANLLLLRVMGRRQMVPEGGRFLAFDATGQLCHTTYHVLGSQPLKMGQEEVPTFGVEQTIHSEDDIPITFHFYLLADGHLARRIQVGSPASCIISRMPTLQEEEEEEPQHPGPVSLGKQPLEWEEDLQLYSMFLDRKEELEAGHATYLRRHPEIQALLSDFLLYLLLHQPSDVATFAAQFFGPFARDVPQPPAFHSSLQPGPFRPPVPTLALTWGPGAERPSRAGNQEGKAAGGAGRRME
ncbi:ciliogenesis-associated TTC17-interacting protein [Tachyglossus aculeatus]|uniref:ciliogenesis-associated TTC17-interacting protein n=1 Tax=Tachyglossus aculeatus TaxID=9261 RepID=UPI0018F73ED0|nr:ciliogenesis-associated TTC17-interacting protein [Tachyglossus aculeatus]